MLIKTMTPVSIVENPSFREWLEVINPAFNTPCRATVKSSALPKLKLKLDENIKREFQKFKWLNVSTDGWIDNTIRFFNGYIAQGITQDWEIKFISFAFLSL